MSVVAFSCHLSIAPRLLGERQAKVEPMLHITIALHKGLNGPLTGTGAMEAPGAGASMTLEVDFQTPGQEGTHHMSMPIGGWMNPIRMNFRRCCEKHATVQIPRYARSIFRAHFPMFRSLACCYLIVVTFPNRFQSASSLSTAVHVIRLFSLRQRTTRFSALQR